MAERAHEAAHERGFPRAELACQVNHRPRLDAFGHGATERERGRLVGKETFQRYHRAVETVIEKLPVEERVKRWGRELGFDAVAIAGIDLAQDEARLIEWLDRGWHGEMDYMARHGARRARPAELVPGTVSVIT